MRISTTIVESYRLYRTESWMSEEAMVASATAEFQSTEKMALGAAFEEAVDHCLAPHEGEVVEMAGECGSVSLTWSGVRAVQNGLPADRVPQVKVVSRIAGHDLVGKADYLSGAEVRDLKTTTKTINIDKYVRSLQWQSYLLLFGGSRFWYDVAYLSEKGGVWDLRDFQQFDCRPYPGMREYLEGWVAEYASWYKELGLEDRAVSV